MISRLLLAAALSVVAAASVLATPYEDGIAAHERGDHEKAVAIMRPLAEAGDIAAEFNVGLAYANGVGVPQDDVQADLWFKKAAEAGYPPAATAYGIMNKFGRGIPADPKAAVFWFSKGAEAGNANAQYQLGVVSMEGQGTERDEARAIQLFESSAQQGFTSAQISLGAAYADGKGIRRDLSRAYMWLTLAAAGMPEGKAHDLTVGLRDEIAKTMSEQEIAASKDKAAAWKAKPAAD